MLNLTGQTFGRLTVIKLSHICRVYRRAHWVCQCSCGRLVTVLSGSLRHGNTQSCGCYRLSQLRKKITKHGGAKGKPHSVYYAWKSMWFRCTNPKSKSYLRYGGRGITICERWRDFTKFQADMLPTWEKGLLLERKDNNGHYNKANCKWATVKEQMNNRHNTIYVNYDGVRMPIQFAKSKHPHLSLKCLSRFTCA